MSVHHRSKYTQIWEWCQPNYVMNNTMLNEVMEIKDVGVCFSALTDLVFANIFMKNKCTAYMMLNTIKRNFVHILRNCFATSYKSLVRDHI